MLGVDPARADAPTGGPRIGIVLQTTGEFDELTVAEVVRHFARYYPDADDPADGDRTGRAWPRRRRARTHTLSGGQQRRLDVALGIIGRPELLFLDEPTTGFDPEARREFWELVRDLAGAGTTILLTTHYLDEAEALADRVGVIAGGRLVAVATPAELGGRATAARRPCRWQEPGRPASGADATRRPRSSASSSRAFARRGPRADGHPAHAGGHLPRHDRQRGGRAVSTTTTTAATRRGSRPAPAARTLAACAQGGAELRQFFRSRESVVFTLAFPMLMFCHLRRDLQRRDRRPA